MAKKSKVIKNKEKEGTIQYTNRCSICSRPRGFLRFFGVCRICFRNLASDGKLPGVTKSSW
jgi:small subunit ribosomal protein S14